MLNKTRFTNKLRLAPAKAGFALASLLPVMAAMPASAVQFDFNDGKIEGSVDTTVSYGAMWRVQGQDHNLVDADATAGTKGMFGNGNDGNYNFNVGEMVSSTYKVTTDFEISSSDVGPFSSVGAFVRGNAFYDELIMDRHNEGADNVSFNGTGSYDQNDFSNQVKSLSGTDARILDAYVFADFEVAGMPANVRIGEQVINWGEGIFFQDSINTVNPADLSKLRLPGSELREALTPEGAIYFQIGLTDNLNMEAYYQYEWHESEADGVGTFFSTSDTIGRGGIHAMTDASSPSALDAVFALDPTIDRRQINIANNVRPDESSHGGQFGVSLRYIAEELNDTEFGLYFINYHSRKPVLNFESGDAFGCASFSSYTTVNVAGTPTYADVAQTGNATSTYSSLCTSSANSYEGLLDGLIGLDTAVSGGAGAFMVSALGNPSLDALITALGFDPTAINVATGLGIVNAATSANQVSAIGATRATNELIYLDTQELQRAYAEDIRMWGLSFNSSVGDTSFAGEMSFRPNMPILTDDLQNVFALSVVQSLSLSASGTGLGNGGTASLSLTDPTATTTAASEQIEFWDRKDVINGSLLAITSHGPILGFDDTTSIFEVGFTHIGGLGSDDKYRSAAGTVRTIQNAEDLDTTGTGDTSTFENADEYISSTSWGYKAVLKGQWNDVYGGVNLSPVINYSEDVSGNSYAGGNFIENRKSMTVALNAVYLNNTEASISYTEFWDAGKNNALRDRDNIAMNVKYSF